MKAKLNIFSEYSPQSLFVVLEVERDVVLVTEVVNDVRQVEQWVDLWTGDAVEHPPWL